MCVERNNTKISKKKKIQEQLLFTGVLRKMVEDKFNIWLSDVALSESCHQSEIIVHNLCSSGVNLPCALEQ